MSREDKKVKVAPFLPDQYMMLVRKISVWNGQGEGDAGRLIVLSSLRNGSALSSIARCFKRDYAVGNVSFIGHKKSHTPVSSLITQYGEGTERLYMRFTKSEFMELDDLTVALGSNWAHTCAALILTIDEQTIERVAPGYVAHYHWRRGV